ncbi:MAG: C13 family peptidase [Candidatus Odinarchaeota archaeon]
MEKTTGLVGVVIVVLLGANLFQYYYFTQLSPPGTPAEDVPADVSDVMGNIADYLGKTVTLEGYYVLGGSNKSLLLKEIDDFQQNAIIPTGRYMQLLGDVPKALTSETGSWIHVKGKVAWSNESKGEGGLQYLPGSSSYEVVTRHPSYAEFIYRFNINISRLPIGARYALLISGGYYDAKAYSRYWNDLKQMYSILVDKYRYDSENIIVLYKDGIAEDSDMPVNNSANTVNFDAAFAYFNATMTSGKDSLFIYTTNHGSASGLCLYYYETISPTHFADQLNTVLSAETIIVMEQCYSGLFIPALSGPKRIIMTAASSSESSWACDTEGSYDEFVYHFMTAVNMETAAGASVTWHDTDSNGYISMREAFNYALVMDSRAEHPHYDDNGDGVGTNAYLLSTVTSGQEGYYGNSVYL